MNRNEGVFICPQILEGLFFLDREIEKDNEREVKRYIEIYRER